MYKRQLVNNAAGMALKDGRVDEISLEDWDAVFASDVRSTFYCTKTVLPFMQEQGAGSIINIGSMASCGGDLGSTAYACAKAGVDMLTQYTAQMCIRDRSSTAYSTAPRSRSRRTTRRSLF